MKHGHDGINLAAILRLNADPALALRCKDLPSNTDASSNLLFPLIPFSKLHPPLL